RARLGDDWDRIRALSIVEDDPDGHKYVRMAHLAVVASRRVNGVADVHSRLMREDLFRDLCELAPDRFASVTNGVTPRRWLAYCNPGLRALISEAVGSEDWVRDLDLLREPLERAAEDPSFRARWVAARAPAKARALDFVARAAGLPALDSAALLDVQVKRVCEYKRQLMNVLAVAHRYLAIRSTPPSERAARFHGPRVCVLAGKAAPGYDTAKRVIKLACAVAAAVNADPEVGAFLRMAFVPDYNVSVAEVLIPGADLSQHISTAGTEASGTGVMKCALNGVLVLGSRDGANLELAREIGEENLFLFGGEAAEVAAARRARRDQAAGPDAGDRPSSEHLDPRLKEVVEAVREGALFGWADYFAPLMDAVCASDEYLVGGDFAAYLDALDRADAAFRDKDRWVRASILSTARSGYFSSDRTIKQYATEIWNVEPMDDVNKT
ncbi:carbohydrate phosphorylase, partial [Helicosporidium sp. ATCC 50920]